MHDMKREFIKSVLFGQSLINGEGHEDTGYATYFTNIGIVSGKRVELQVGEYESADEIMNDILERSQRGESISTYQLAYATLDISLKKAGSDYNFDNIDTKAIVLEDVVIKTPTNDRINTNSFVLFTDQITGMIPGKFDL